MSLVTISRLFSRLSPIEVEIGTEFDGQPGGVRLGAAVKIFVARERERGVRPDLCGCDLCGCDLSGSNLRDSDLSGCDLSGCDLRDAKNISLAALRPIRADFFDVLLRARAEVPFLLAALRGGEIDGSTYSGECACLAGTIAHARQCTVDALGFSDAGRPAERWFLAMHPGDTPANHPIAKITEEWIIEFMALAGIAEEAA
jgi:hypothetical protein